MEVVTVRPSLPIKSRRFGQLVKRPPIVGASRPSRAWVSIGIVYDVSTVELGAVNYIVVPYLPVPINSFPTCGF